MELTFRKNGRNISFFPKGRVTGADARKLGDAFAKALALGGDLRSAHVFLGGLAEMDDDAVDVVADWHARFRRDGSGVRLAEVPEALRERFRERGVFDFDDGDTIDEKPIIV